MPLKLPRLPYEQKQYTPQIVTFGGVNYSQNHRDGELEDCRNLSSREYPCLSQRLGRKEFGQYANGSAIYAHGKLITVDDTQLLCNGKAVGQVSAGEKEFAVVNTKLVIWPDKKFLDLENLEFGKLDYTASSSLGTTTAFTQNSVKMETVYETERNSHMWFSSRPTIYSVQTGAGFLVKVYSAVSWENDGWVLEGEETRCIGQMGGSFYTPPMSYDALKPNDIVVLRNSEISGSYQINSYSWSGSYDPSTGESQYEESKPDEPHAGGFYAVVKSIETEGMYGVQGLQQGNYVVTFQVMNVKYPVDDLTTKFRVGDRVQISGCETTSNNTKEDTHLVIQGVTNDTLSFDDETFIAGQDTGEVKVQRVVPPIEHICALNNRLWGTEGSARIWGSALGDPANFYVNDGISTDSYAVAVGSDGDFTGCIGYGGNVLFWKEDKLHKLLGTAPDNYQLYEYTVRGLMDGCHKSQVIINETLFFKSRDGVCAYTGSVPSLISENFGVRRFRDATAGTDDEKYYISMQDTQTDAWGLWVFDPATGLWLQEGAERVLDFANLDGTLYMLMDGGQVLMTGQTDSGEVIEWEATFCEMTEQHHERKCYSRLLLRMDMEQGAFCRGEISVDGGPFREVGILHGARNKTGEMLVQPTNCDRFQVRLKGRGRCRLKSLIREFTFGGER